MAMAETASPGCALGPPLQLVQIKKHTTKPNLNPSELVIHGRRATAAPSGNLGPFR